MKIKTHRLGMLPIAALVMLAGGLGACGGDGGDTPPAPVATLDLTAANSDTVAHATATGMLAFGASTMVPFDADAGAPVRALGLAALPGSNSWLPQRVLDTLMQAAFGGGRAASSALVRPLALVTSAPQACGFGGTITLSFDDTDNNRMLGLGENFSFVFDQCQDDASEVISGSVSGAITRIGSTTTPSFSAVMTLAQLSQAATDGRHGLTLNGRVLLDFEEPNASTEKMNLVADGAVMATAYNHLPYNDTVTLQSGFVQASTYDLATGRTISSVSGVMDSSTAGGSFVVTTLTPIDTDDSAAYPTSGVVKMAGRTGVMTLTALPNDQVLVGLDADGNGSYESSVAHFWDWLF